MVLLKKEDLLYDRDENGKFIPKKVKLVEDVEGYENCEVEIVPMTRGELKKMFANFKGEETTRDQDAEMLFKYLFDPKIEKDKDIDALKPELTNAIVTTILHYSGIKSKKLPAKQLEAKDSEFLKKS